ncbi:MAG TPA: M14 family zinc carboxypeptidase [Noviherbaspirillum sp.]|uniref:M14 family zinc carboxypeptidase n=1 Tax=Noviherbaspirillum sp. TaxID=1926288 RepID=UPI002B483FD6|nr:M14 family zinc carboxypeptidase [Noviherbaspirillum sp.]HJV87254.1 M14 family zinc carboxypeptidase [Noviherbaspirillum sp.]
MTKFLRHATAFLAAAISFSALANTPSVSPAKPADWCKLLTPRLPGVSLAACQRSALIPTGAHSRNGIPILMRSIPAARKGKHGEPVRVLLLGGIHGDELTASAIVFQWTQWMQSQPAQEFSWHIAPVVNPDGLLARKPQRVNANGVDLNRNFPTPGWEKDAQRYWAKVTGSDPRRFPGQSPLSEPETRWLNDEMERFRPDVIISVHAPFGVLDMDGPAKAPHRFGRLYFSRVGVYPGSLGNYGGLHKNVPVITIELPNALAMPPQAEVQRIWQDMLVWIGRSVSPQSKKTAALSVQRTAATAALAAH